MTENYELEIYRQFQISQDKYTYFILALASSAIVYSLKLTEGRNIEWKLLPIALSVILWLFSIYYGCKFILNKNSALYSNFELLKLKNATTKDMPSTSAEYYSKIDILYNQMNNNSLKAMKFADRQFKFMITGIISFVLWYLLDIIDRSFK